MEVIKMNDNINNCIQEIISGLGHLSKEIEKQQEANEKKLMTLEEMTYRSNELLMDIARLITDRLG